MRQIDFGRLDFGQIDFGQLDNKIFDICGLKYEYE